MAGAWCAHELAVLGTIREIRTNPERLIQIDERVDLSRSHGCPVLVECPVPDVIAVDEER